MALFSSLISAILRLIFATLGHENAVPDGRQAEKSRHLCLERQVREENKAGGEETVADPRLREAKGVGKGLPGHGQAVRDQDAHRDGNSPAHSYR